jgi:CBS domain-containing protein
MDLERNHGDDHHTEAAHAELSRLPYRMPSRSVADRVPISTIMMAHASGVQESLGADVMPTPHGFTLKEDASVSAAAATMAREGLQRVRVVCSLGKMVGVVSALDIMRWLAEQDGYNARK